MCSFNDDHVFVAFSAFSFDRVYFCTAQQYCRCYECCFLSSLPSRSPHPRYPFTSLPLSVFMVDNCEECWHDRNATGTRTLCSYVCQLLLRSSSVYDTPEHEAHTGTAVQQYHVVFVYCLHVKKPFQSLLRTYLLDVRIAGSSVRSIECRRLSNTAAALSQVHNFFALGGRSLYVQYSESIFLMHLAAVWSG